MTPRYISPFLRLNTGELITKARPTVLALTETGVLGFNWQPFGPAPNELKDSFGLLEASHAGAQGGDNVKAVEMKTRQEEFTRIFGEVLDLVALAARRDATVIVKTALDWIKAGASPNPARTTATIPRNLTLKHGLEHGVIIGKCGAVKGAKSMEVWFTEDPNDEASWRFCGVYPRCTKMEFTNLTPGKLYWFRVRAILPSGKSPWSQAVSLMAI